MMSLAQAQQSIAAAIAKQESIVCPCCNRQIRFWKRTIVSTAAHDLIALVLQYDGANPVHIDHFTKQRSNFYTLDYWDLIVPEPNDDPKKRASGLWHPTQKGVDFAFDRTTVTKYVVTMDNVVVARGGRQITIRDALKKKFDYEQLLADQNP